MEDRTRTPLRMRVTAGDQTLAPPGGRAQGPPARSRCVEPRATCNIYFALLHCNIHTERDTINQQQKPQENTGAYIYAHIHNDKLKPTPKKRTKWARKRVRERLQATLPSTHIPAPPSHLPPLSVRGKVT